MPERHPLVVPIIVGTIALLALISVCTMSICALRGLTQSTDVKEIAIATSSALTAFMVSLRGNQGAPSKVEVANTPEDPVPTKPQP